MRILNLFLTVIFSGLLLISCGSPENSQNTLSSDNVANIPSDTLLPDDTEKPSDTLLPDDTEKPSEDTIEEQVFYDEVNILPLSKNSQFVDLYTSNSYQTILYYAPDIPVDKNYTTKSYTITTTGGNTANLSNKQNRLSISNGEIFNYSSFRDLEKYFLENKIPQVKPVLKKSTSSYQVGSIKNDVYVSRTGDTTFTKVNIKCVGISEYAYLFIETTSKDYTQDIIEKIKAGIDGLFPIIHEKYGTPNDVDGNGKVIVLFTPFTDNNLMGYFFSGDKYTKIGYQYSNESDIFYINYNVAKSDIDGVLSTIAHEYQHMIHFDVRHNNNLNPLDLWINEGLSMQAMHHSGYLSKQRADYVSYFINSYAGETLLEDGSNEFSIGNYGYTLVFFRYLLERFGDEIIKKIYASKETGYKVIEEVTGHKFNNIFDDFIKTIFLAGYGYKLPIEHSLTSLDLTKYKHLKFFLTLNAGEGFTGTIIPYGIHLINWNGVVNTVNLNGPIKGYGYSFDDK